MTERLELLSPLTICVAFILNTLTAFGTLFDILPIVHYLASQAQNEDLVAPPPPTLRNMLKIILRVAILVATTALTVQERKTKDRKEKIEEETKALVQREDPLQEEMSHLAKEEGALKPSLNGVSSQLETLCRENENLALKVSSYRDKAASMEVRLRDLTNDRTNGMNELQETHRKNQEIEMVRARLRTAYYATDDEIRELTVQRSNMEEEIMFLQEF